MAAKWDGSAVFLPRQRDTLDEGRYSGAQPCKTAPKLKRLFLASTSEEHVSGGPVRQWLPATDQLKLPLWRVCILKRLTQRANDEVGGTKHALLPS